jgi:hypothetical protein
VLHTALALATFLAHVMVHGKSKTLAKTLYIPKTHLGFHSIDIPNAKKVASKTVQVI